KGMMYRRKKPVYWCIADQTALAEAEVEYEDHESPSIYVAMRAGDEVFGKAGLEKLKGREVDYVIWTTTPWTIPANLAIAVHPQAEYAVVRAVRGFETAYYLVAVPLLEATMMAMGVDSFETVKTLAGVGLQGLVFKHPLFHRTSP